MKKYIIPALRLTVVSLILLTVIYPAILWAVAQLAPNQGRGVLIETKDAVYYQQIGQKFDADQYFWSRPSAVDYNAAGSGASNLSTTNPEYLKTVEERIAQVLAHNPTVKKEDIPADLVTASASGLDPHVSLQAAKIQLERIAQVRNLAISDLQELLQQHTDKPLWGMFGPEKVNVVALNIALDQLSQEKGVNHE